jgi:hypothetical protein
MLPAWMPGPEVSGGFLEGSAVRLPEGGVGLLLRCRVYDGQGRMYDLQHACFFKLRPRPAGGMAQETAAALLLASTAQFHPHGLQQRLPDVPKGRGPPGSLAWQGFVSMPGGGNKFIVRYDGSTGQYLALTNPSIDRYGSNPDARNILVLVSR